METAALKDSSGTAESSLLIESIFPTTQLWACENNEAQVLEQYECGAVTVHTCGKYV